MQSPIDLLNERVQVVSHLGRLKRSYKPSYATLKNRGHDMMVIEILKNKIVIINEEKKEKEIQYYYYFSVASQLHWLIFFYMFLNYLRMQLQWHGGAGTLLINGTEYVLKQCHWHSPSEHTINGERYCIFFFSSFPFNQRCIN